MDQTDLLYQICNTNTHSANSERIANALVHTIIHVQDIAYE